MLGLKVLLLCLCLGLVYSAPESRVVNGTDSQVENFPFIISLRSKSGSHSCGGSIIAPSWVLTAAHCVDGVLPESRSIQYAVTEVDKSGPNVATIKRFIVHENYDDQLIVNDVALIEVHGKFLYNGKTLGPVALPIQNYEIPQTRNGVNGKLIGWGRIGTGLPTSTVLQEVDLKIYSDSECAERHGANVSPNNICGGVDEGWKGQCSGDSGGPLLNEDNVQLGIVSWSIKPCTVPPYPGVYTKVSHYVDWINKNMKS